MTLGKIQKRLAIKESLFLLGILLKGFFKDYSFLKGHLKSFQATLVKLKAFFKGLFLFEKLFKL
jgi:hypothetical protein